MLRPAFAAEQSVRHRNVCLDQNHKTGWTKDAGLLSHNVRTGRTNFSWFSVTISSPRTTKMHWKAVRGLCKNVRGSTNTHTMDQSTLFILAVLQIRVCVWVSLTDDRLTACFSFIHAVVVLVV